VQLEEVSIRTMQVSRCIHAPSMEGDFRSRCQITASHFPSEPFDTPHSFTQLYHHLDCSSPLFKSTHHPTAIRTQNSFANNVYVQP